MSAQEKFEVGQTVFWKIPMKWVEVFDTTVSRDGEYMVSVKYEHGATGNVRAYEFTANPVIPPKPVRMVTKEAIGWFETLCALGSDRRRTYTVPIEATNICCTYEVPET
jgi:hypothetical protein